MWGEIIAATISGTAAVTAAVVAKRQAQRAAQAEREMTMQRAALDFGQFVEEWGDTMRDLEALMEETPIDRFLILRAWNGANTPRWTTAVFQMRQGRQQPISYVHFELDTDYVERLREISIRNTMHFQVADIPPSAIRSVYEAEGVTAAVWSHLASHVVGPDARAVTYCSFATHSEEPLPESTLTRCRVMSGRLKGVALAFEAREEAAGRALA